MEIKTIKLDQRILTRYNATKGGIRLCRDRVEAIRFLRGSHHSLLASFFGKTSNNGIETDEHPLLSVLSVRGASNIVVCSIRDKEKVKRKKRK